MSRRPNSALGMRRPARTLDAGGLGTFADILGPNLLANFDARFLSSAGSWTDTIRGITATPPGTTTTYAADGTNFRGLPVHQCAVAGGAVLRALSPAPPIWLAGERPYVFSVCRARVYPAGNAMLGCRVLAFDGSINTLAIQATLGTNVLGRIDPETGTVNVAFNNTAVHAWELFYDSSGVTVLAIDGATVGTAGTGQVLAKDSGNISFGGSHTGTLPSDSSHALHLLCRSVPTADQRAAMLQLARDIWGF